MYDKLNLMQLSKWLIGGAAYLVITRFLFTADIDSLVCEERCQVKGHFIKYFKITG